MTPLVTFINYIIFLVLPSFLFALLIIFFQFLVKRSTTDLFSYTFFLGISATIIGYMSTFSRETAIPHILPPLITLFSGYLIFEYTKKEKNKDLNFHATFLSCIYFIIILSYGAFKGAYDRNIYEIYHAPKDQAAKESLLNSARKKYGVNLKCLQN